MVQLSSCTCSLSWLLMAGHSIKLVLPEYWVCGNRLWPWYNMYRYNTSYMATPVRVGQSVTARYAESCDQEHCTVMTTTTPMGDIKIFMFSSMFLRCEYEIYSSLREVFAGYVLFVVYILHRIVSLCENVCRDLYCQTMNRNASWSSHPYWILVSAPGYYNHDDCDKATISKITRPYLHELAGITRAYLSAANPRSVSLKTHKLNKKLIAEKFFFSQT